MKKISFKILYPIIGLAALTWFLIRVIPKPSRAAYPCQQAAFPIASAFVIYIAALVSSVLAFKKLHQQWKDRRLLALNVSMLTIIISCFFLLQSDRPLIYADNRAVLEDPNTPIGTGKGIIPGGVVWVHDQRAVNQEFEYSNDNYWWQEKNADQDIINMMVSNTMKSLTKQETDSAAWNALFRNFNITNGKGDKGYTPGEKIVIKINLNNGARGTEYTRTKNQAIETSPQIMYAVLDQLVNKAGIPQADIGFGDPGRNVDNIFWDYFHDTFPDVNYWGNGNGRTPVVPSENYTFFNSDGEIQNYLPECYIEAEYMINIPVFKQHHRSGISLTSKNHFGTFCGFLGNAYPFHYSLPCTEGNNIVNNGEYGSYRVFVDFIGHKDIGAKTILFLIDGLWSSTDWGDPAWKWEMEPFNGTYPASIFASQDPVAIESVGFDFLYAEFYQGNSSGKDFPSYAGADDFLHQAADSSNWPADIKYDPENDGSYLPGSMGVHEHWNNASEKLYKGNITEGEGIKLIPLTLTSAAEDAPGKPETFLLENNFPNPFNPHTTIRYKIVKQSDVKVEIYNTTGEMVSMLINENQSAGEYEITWDGKNNVGSVMPSGVYFYKMQAGKYSELKKMILLK
ncbi:MAG: DUF362 domain-containing protein [Ignavibacteriaceae bacterium]